MAMQTTLVLQFKDISGKTKSINIANPVNTLSAEEIRKEMEALVKDKLFLPAAGELVSCSDPLRREVGIWTPKTE